MPHTSTLTDAALTTLINIKEELGIIDVDDDNYLTRVINYVSAFVANYCGRTFERADGIVEGQQGECTPYLILDRRPILTLTSVTLDGSVVTITDDIKIHNAESGILYRESGWVFTGWLDGRISNDPIVGTEDLLYQITYNAGYVTPEQAKTGGTFAGEAVTVPFDLEDAVIQLIVSRESRRAQDPGVAESSLTKYRETLRSGTFEEQFPSVAMILKRYRRVLVG